jgi:2-oxoglutarate dehydrogenase E1 component
MTTIDFSEFGPNAGFVAGLKEEFEKNPNSLSSEWRTYFGGGVSTNGHYSNTADSFRRFGHFLSKINPLVGAVSEPGIPKDLPEALTSNDPTTVALRRIYTGSVGFDFMHLTSESERNWLIERIERDFPSQTKPTPEVRKRILRQLLAGELIESELHKKFVGAKRFSLEGGETLIGMLHELLLDCESDGLQEAVFGMAHRGRLSVLVNVLGKPLETLFSEFEDQSVASVIGDGDVKYHLGFGGTFQRHLKVSMIPNPSHLEFVNPVVEGISRALQDRSYGGDRKKVLPIVMHGDAAFAGQGIVFECINFSRIRGYETGGTLHIVINNQIGFTTTPDEGRSTRYCTDLAKGVDAPVFHVNCEDVEASVWVTRLAYQFRQEFGKDVFIDLLCYRKYGHNEGDDPSFTQPLTYAEIKTKKPIYQMYAQSLVQDGALTESDLETMVADYKLRFSEAQAKKSAPVQGEVCSLHGRLRIPDFDTGVPKSRLIEVADCLTAYPDGFEAHPKLSKIIEKRVETVHVGEGIEWGSAEALAFGSLVQEGIKIRLSGQDSCRGTFSHRHLVLDNYSKPGTFSPLTTLKGEGSFEVYNSPLSENSVLGFEFGFASVTDRSLTLWEAQFGDFVNGAQVIIDQFLASSEVKWGQLSGLTLLLPHGYEGQGPEHSSARLERFLQLSAEGNMTVAYPSSAAQYFHLLRRQALSAVQRPLIVMTPKSLLRLPSAGANLTDLTSGQFQPVIVEDFGIPECAVLMTGKIYYDVKTELEKRGTSGVRVIRIEQLHPFPQFDFKKMLGDREARPEKIFWVQEEPENMGAWNYLQSYLEHKLGLHVNYIGRPPSGSTATGSNKRHLREQKAILDALFEQIEA